eukprot:TRINITY_DN8427_c0_g1_i4.p2 TRINITY_DN8427_c0_g1~~TRINITY_DN8427_c0_g1_i4.p2  ORF type:complete len:107 (-),score=12.96 TRINITY_DN8427_c0_g1_i4:191-511(-)
MKQSIHKKCFKGRHGLLHKLRILLNYCLQLDKNNEFDEKKKDQLKCIIQKLRSLEKLSPTSRYVINEFQKQNVILRNLKLFDCGGQMELLAQEMGARIDLKSSVQN